MKHPRSTDGSIECLHGCSQRAMRRGTGMTQLSAIEGPDWHSFTFALVMHYNGQYKGIGRYIKGARIYSDSLRVAWGFNFDANVETLAITNLGSKDSPLAGLTLQLNYVVKSILLQQQSSHIFHLTGDGQVSSDLKTN